MLHKVACLLLEQHGRVKTKSTAQQEEEKRKEREKKLKIYVSARDTCFSKVTRNTRVLLAHIYTILNTLCFASQRKDGVFDDEALQVTQQLLSSNPDFATLWNYRREILMHLETVR